MIKSEIIFKNTNNLQVIRCFGFQRPARQSEHALADKWTTYMITSRIKDRTRALQEIGPASSNGQVFDNYFIRKPLNEHIQDWHNREMAPSTHESDDLVATCGYPHHKKWNWLYWLYSHYSLHREPPIIEKPDLSKNELVAGAQNYRSDVWKTDNEPSIVSVGNYGPDNFRHVSYATNAPNPASTISDHHIDFRETRLNTDHANRKPFYYLVQSGTFMFTAVLVRTALIKMVTFMYIPRDQVAGGSVEVDLRQISAGQNYSVNWRGKPVFIKHRLPWQISEAKKDDSIIASFKDPEADADRHKRPEWLIVKGVCTHLGCIPVPDEGKFKGYFCACHGSHYDLSGRIRLGPAPLNLEIPPYKFIDDNTLFIG
eukprot:GHVL01021758.1.p2 GENE.GHVL01021758.1~~GHVL01021758.1.p2  ORF type:complete len:371 (-),score=31.76 GHVL01021758.1:90-1202(-)